MNRVSVKLLRLSLGLFFIVLGIIGVIPRVQESVFSLNDNFGLEIIFGVVELVCGLILIAGLMTFLRKKAVSIASAVVFCFWILRVVLSKFIWGISAGNHGIIFRPLFSVWILVLSVELVIAAGLFLVYRAYE
jgi:hypothetical protein